MRDFIDLNSHFKQNSLPCSLIMQNHGRVHITCNIFETRQGQLNALDLAKIYSQHWLHCSHSRQKSKGRNRCDLSFEALLYLAKSFAPFLQANALLETSRLLLCPTQRFLPAEAPSEGILCTQSLTAPLEDDSAEVRINLFERIVEEHNDIHMNKLKLFLNF